MHIHKICYSIFHADGFFIVSMTILLFILFHIAYLPKIIITVTL